MKNLPAIISIATVAVFLLLAVAASVIDSLPCAFMASYVVGFACSIQLFAMFVEDYGPRSPRLVESVSIEVSASRDLAAAKAAEAEWQLGSRSEGAFSDPVTMK